MAIRMIRDAYKESKSKNSRVRVLQTTAWLTAVLLLCGCGNTNTTNNAPGSQTSVADSEGNEKTSSQATEVEEEGIKYPYSIDDGKISINSVFSSDIDNPDADYENVEGLISIEAENTSGEYLENAELTITLEDGTTAPINITKLPAGEKVWAFAYDNSCVEKGSVEIKVKEITADKSQYESIAEQIPENLEIRIEGTSITLSNKSDKNMKNMKVYCHTSFDGILYGGITYTYTVDSLSAGETTIIEADDCWLGEPEVVGVSVD